VVFGPKIWKKLKKFGSIFKINFQRLPLVSVVAILNIYFFSCDIHEKKNSIFIFILFIITLSIIRILKIASGQT